MPTTDDKRDTYRGASDGLTQAFEFALVPAIFGGVGYVFDRLFGIVPVLTIVMVVVALVGLFVRMKYRYEAKMAIHDRDGAWSSPTSTESAPASTGSAPTSAESARTSTGPAR